MAAPAASYSLAAAALGLAAGFRQSSLLVLAPLFLFSIRRVPRRLALGGVGALGLVLMAWFIPMLDASGGMSAYASSLWSLWRLVPARQTVFTSSVFTTLARLCLIVAIYVLCFGAAALAAAASIKTGRRESESLHLDLALPRTTPLHLGLLEIRQQWISPGLVAARLHLAGLLGCRLVPPFHRSRRRQGRPSWAPRLRSTARSSSALPCTFLIATCIAPSKS